MFSNLRLTKVLPIFYEKVNHLGLQVHYSGKTMKVFVLILANKGRLAEAHKSL